MDALPPYLPEPAATLPPARQQLLRDARHLQQEITAYNRRLEIVLSHYIHLLEQANNCISRLYTQVAFPRNLSPHGNTHAKESHLEAETRT